MAEEKKTPAKKTAAKKPELLFEDGYWWIVTGSKKENVGRNERYARRIMEQQ